MAGNSTYGTVKHSLIDPSKDVEIWYHYRPTRNSVDEDFKSFKKIDDPSSIFTNSYINNPIHKDFADNRLPGMYDLKLPVSIFGKKGFYTVYIKPKEIVCEIKDVGALAAYPDIRGIVIDTNSSEVKENKQMFANDNLTGYRVEYFESDGTEGLKRQEYYRLITSNNYADPVSQNLTSANSNSNGYRFNASGSLCFLTLTPSTAPSFKSNTKPYIGVPNQKIVITNTKFDPVMIEIEMCEHDFETMSYMLEGEQVRNLEDGTVITYNFEGNPYTKFEYMTLKNNYNKKNIFEAKLRKDTNIEEKITLEELRNS